MIIIFYKYQGTGNDFILIDDRSNQTTINSKKIKDLCSRKFGIGSDGIILIRDKEGYDFEMIFYNPDGSQSFCGNGSRCAVLFAYHMGIIGRDTIFWSTDGEHSANIKDGSLVELKMKDPVKIISIEKKSYFVDTGSPHFVQFKENIQDIDFIKECKKIRYNNLYKEQGVNVNFIEKNESGISMRTYERGVEDETLSCGTGVTAAALVYAHDLASENGEIEVDTKGGKLKVRYHKNSDHYSDVWLIGPAEYVFKGDIDL